MPLPDIEPFDGLDQDRFALLTFMHYWSEEFRAAQWYGDLEFFLLTVGPETVETLGAVPANFQEAYRDLIENTGGWFTYGRDGVEFVHGTYEQLVAAAQPQYGKHDS